MSITGIDVSSYQPGFNWKQAAQEGIQFGICKRSEGCQAVDSQFDYHWKAIKDAGLARGTYAFSRWDRATDPVAEAQWFLSHLPALETGDFVALDVEASPDQVAGYELSAWALTWLVTVERALGFRPLVYSGYSFAQSYLTDPLLATYGLWVAAYGPPTCPAPVGPWPMVAMWQRSSSAPYAGMQVDESVFYGSVAQLRAYGKPAPPPFTPVPAVSQPSSAAKPAVPSVAGPRFLATVDMMARSAPDLASVIWQNGRPWMVNKGAVLNGAGTQTPHFVEVFNQGRKVWLWLSNTRPV